MGAMDRLNNLRVGFKHKGNVPNPAVVAELMPSVAAFCLAATSQYLGIDYETVRLADLIQNAEAREKVKEAEKAKTESNIPGGLLALGVAFDKLRDEAGRKHSWSLIQQGYWERVGRVRAIGRYDRALVAGLNLGELAKVIRQVIETVNMLVLGIEPTRLHRFSATTPRRLYASSGVMESWWEDDPKAFGKEDFDFCHQFVIDFALRLASAR